MFIIVISYKIRDLIGFDIVGISHQLLGFADPA